VCIVLVCGQSYCVELLCPYLSFKLRFNVFYYIDFYYDYKSLCNCAEEVFFLYETNVTFAGFELLKEVNYGL
jgi:hypothetical protein